ncbi:MAG: alpha-L-fucosidase [Acidobacteriaceae bacterium]|nr:alpha-L-fucosidase [Acidobacteriaceae bacterium]
MKRLLTFLLFATSLSAQTYQPNWDSLDKRPTPSWYQDAKFGLIIHWGLYSVPAYAPVKPSKLAYSEWYWNAMTEGRKGPHEKSDDPASTDPEIQAGTWAYHQKVYGPDFAYQDFAPMFKAQLFDPDHWADVFERAGLKYVAFVSKHHDGYAMWPSKEASNDWGRPWNAVDIGPHRDVLGDLTTAVRSKGIRMGFYYSLYEWYNPMWQYDRERYVREHMFPQFKDLVTRYKPDILFTDGEWEMTAEQWHSPELLAWLFNESPVKDSVAINDRWGSDTRHKHGGYWSTEYTAGMSSGDHPWEEARGMGVSFGYNRAEGLDNYHTSRELVIMLSDIVSRGGNLLLDIGPRADGTIPLLMEERLLEIGNWLKVNGDAIYGTRPWKTAQQWSSGERPKDQYNSEYNSAYDITKQVGEPKDGKASIEAFFTSKGSDVFAILPRWPGHSFLIRDLASAKSVELLGATGKLTFKPTKEGLLIQLPELPQELSRQPAWVLRVSQ